MASFSTEITESPHKATEQVHLRLTITIANLLR